MSRTHLWFGFPPWTRPPRRRLLHFDISIVAWVRSVGLRLVQAAPAHSLFLRVDPHPPRRAHPVSPYVHIQELCTRNARLLLLEDPIRMGSEEGEDLLCGDMPQDMLPSQPHFARRSLSDVGVMRSPYDPALSRLGPVCEIFFVHRHKPVRRTLGARQLGQAAGGSVVFINLEKPLEDGQCAVPPEVLGLGQLGGWSRGK